VTRPEIVRSAYDAWNLRNVRRLEALTHPEVEIAPLIIGATSAGPWSGHDGVRKLVADAATRWHRFDLRCDEILEFGERVVALVHVEVATTEGGPKVTGDIAHLIEFDGELVTRFIAYREAADAVKAAEA
jgi:ketosteroid isomerase-like protein